MYSLHVGNKFSQKDRGNQKCAGLVHTGVSAPNYTVMFARDAAVANLPMIQLVKRHLLMYKVSTKLAIKTASNLINPSPRYNKL